MAWYVASIRRGLQQTRNSLLVHGNNMTTQPPVAVAVNEKGLEQSLAASAELVPPHTSPNFLSHEPLKSAMTISSEMTSDLQDAPREFQQRRQWRPSIWRLRPLIGVASMVIAIASLLVSLAILIASDGDLVTRWAVQPTVYLAIASAVSNMALQCALCQAAPVSWWYKALRGSSIKDLELDWEAGQSFPRAFVKSIKYKKMFSLFSIASFATALVLVDGPLLQRSSSVKRSSTEHITSLGVSLAPELPPGFSGTISNGAFIFSDAMLAIGDAWVRKLPMHSPTTCNGTCYATVRGPGLASVECNNRTWPITESMLRNPSLTWGQYNTSAGYGLMDIKPLVYSYLMTTALDVCVSGREPLWVATGTANYRDCQGSFSFANCTLLPAIVDYDIKIQDNEVSFASPPPHTGRVQAFADRSCEKPSHSVGQPLSVGNLVNYLTPYVLANGRLGVYLSTMGSQDEGPIETWFIDTFNAFSMSYFDLAASQGECTVVTRDPMDDIIGTMNELMFRSGILAATWPNMTLEAGVHQVVSAVQTKDENVFVSDTRWFFGAAAIQILAIVLILPAYRGWWTIGVELSLSPFQTAKAFDAPLFRDINSAAGATGLLNELGDERLKLGVVKVAHSTCEATYRRDFSTVPSPYRTRLEIATENRSTVPFKDVRFDE